MTLENRKNELVVGTVFSTRDNKIEICCEEWGRILIEKGDNWDNGHWSPHHGDWEDTINHYKAGDKVDLVRMYPNDFTQKSLYGFYPFGSLTDSQVKENIIKIDKVMDFINRPQQEAFVKAVVYQDNNTYIDCWSPVWKKIEFQEPGYFSAKRGDTLIIERKVIAQDNVSVTYKFNLVRNKTLEDEQTAWINKTLSGFTDAERNKLLLLSDDMRMNKK